VKRRRGANRAPGIGEREDETEIAHLEARAEASYAIHA
jgi:hypothetical protein